MRWIVGTTLVLILVLHTGGPLVCAQKQQARPADVEPVRSYVSPSALKSVEIGDYYLRRKKLNAALSRFQEALKTDPHYAPAYRSWERSTKEWDSRRKRWTHIGNTWTNFPPPKTLGKTNASTRLSPAWKKNFPREENRRAAKRLGSSNSLGRACSLGV